MWLDGLRSGEYEQGSGFLRRGDQHCAIGVLCAVSGEIEFKETNNPNFPGLYLCEHKESGLGAGFHACEHWVTEKQWRRISDMNDEGRSFAQIANWIEANVPVDAPADAPL